MDVNPNKSLQASQGVVKPNTKKRVSDVSPAKALKKTSSTQGVTENFSLHEAVRATLDAMPEIRRNLVETGRELAADENYPSAKDLDDLGRLALKQFIKERKAGLDG